MPRKRKTSIYLKRRPDGDAVWYIRDGDVRVSTGFKENAKEAAEQSLSDYLANNTEISTTYLYAKLHLAKRRAKAKNRSFSLTVDDIRRLGIRQNWRCALTGLPFSFRGDKWSRPRSMVIDRIDSLGGYEAGNVRLVLHAINVAIGPWGEDEFAPIAAAFLSRYRQAVEHRNDTETPSESLSKAVSN